MDIPILVNEILMAKAYRKNILQGIQSELTAKWLELIQAIEKRDQALESAGEIHR